MRRIADIVTGRHTLAEVEGAFGRTRVYDTRHREYGRLRVLDVEGTWQSGCYVDERWSQLAFEYHRCFAEILFACDAPDIRHMLMLGGGGMSFPRYVATHHTFIKTDVIEADPHVIQLAHTYFFLDALAPEQAQRIEIICDDAGAYLRRCSENKAPRYDAIINDAFAAQYVPASLDTATLPQLLHTMLTPHGLYLANVISALKGPKSQPLKHATRILEKTFSNVWVLPLGSDEPQISDNNVVVATDSTYVPGDALSVRELFG